MILRERLQQRNKLETWQISRKERRQKLGTRADKNIPDNTKKIKKINNKR